MFGVIDGVIGGVIDGNRAGMHASAPTQNILLERDFEVRALKRALDGLARGRGGVVSVESAASLGKTALLQQACELAAEAGFALLSARGAELEREFTFGLVRQLFEFTGAARATESLFAAADLPSGPDDARPDGSGSGSGSVYSLLNGLYRLLVNLAETVPVVILIDDAQWADSASLRFLGFLARRMDAVAVTVIVASRSGSREGSELLDDLLTASDTTVLEPKALSESAVAELVRQSLGRDADAEFCAACHAVTAGNPLFVRELLRVLAANGTYPGATAVASVWAAGPDAVRRPVVARLRRQPEDVRAIARAVAVLGDHTDLTLVARQAGLALPAVAAAAAELIHCGVFERANPPAFAHGVVREVVRSAIPAADSQAAHERAALILQEAGEPATRVAAHLLRTLPDGTPGDNPARLELARTLERLGTTRPKDENCEEGWAVIRRAAELAAECRAPVMAERLQALLAGSSAAPARPHRTGVRAFTPSERQVAQLAAAGLTNRKIAEHLFLSEKTVEAHLSRAYRKLGVRSRTQLAVRMAAVPEPRSAQ